jgi:hypothetical protein
MAIGGPGSVTTGIGIALDLPIEFYDPIRKSGLFKFSHAVGDFGHIRWGLFPAGKTVKDVFAIDRLASRLWMELMFLLSFLG